ncbi:MAG: hypothetical protein JXA77_19455, partial [Bacteroidales bacterium]|nr:hypothetical protein [Bacteroidales bacterium]
QYLLENTQTQNNGSEFRGPEPVLSEPIDLGGLPEVGNGGGNGWEITGIVNNSVNTVAYGAILAGGSVAYSKYGSLWFQYYASAWTGGSRASIRTLNLTKLGARIGTGTSIIGGGLAFGQYFTSGDLPSDRARLAVGLLCAGLTYTPEPISTGVGIGLGILDASGGMNWLYNYVDYKYQRPFNISNDPLYIIDIDSNGNVTNVQYIGP